MNQRFKVLHLPLVTHDQPAEVLQPRIRPLNDPSALVTTHFSSILVRCHPVVRPRRDDRFDATFHQQCPRAIAVLAPVCKQAANPSSPGTPRADAPVRQRFFDQFHFRWGSRLHVKSSRSTRAIGQYHELCSLAALGFADFRAPFLAVTNMPSMKHSFHRTLRRSSSWSKKARHRFKSRPDSAHSLSPAMDSAL